MKCVWLGVVPFVLVGCNAFPVGPVMCTAQVVDALRVTVRDARGGAPESASVTARDGDFVQTVTSQRPPDAPALEFRLAAERAGTYTVTVNAPGYNTYSRSGIRVSRDACHPRTVGLDVQLTPSG